MPRVRIQIATRKFLCMGKRARLHRTERSWVGSTTTNATAAKTEEVKRQALMKPSWATVPISAFVAAENNRLNID